MSSGRQKQHPPDEDEAESGLTTALKVGAVGLGVGVLAAFGKWLYEAGASSRQPPARTTVNYYMDNRTFQQNDFTIRQNNLTLQQNNRTVVINPHYQSNHYQNPYRNSYPPSNLSLPACSSDDRRVPQYKRNSTTSKPKSYSYSKEDHSSDESDPDQQSSQYKRNSTISRPKSYYSFKDGDSSNESDPDEQSSQYMDNRTFQQNDFTIRQNNLTLQQDNRTVVINPQCQSNHYQNPYRNSYPPSNLSLPACFSDDHRVPQYEGNNTVALYYPNERYARCDNPSPSYRTPIGQGPRATAPPISGHPNTSATAQPNCTTAPPVLQRPIAELLDQDLRPQDYGTRYYR